MEYAQFNFECDKKNFIGIKRFHEFKGKINRSSAFMLYILNCVIQGKIPDNDIIVYNPNDVEDFVLCGMLVIVKPEFRNYLAILSLYSGTWKGIVENWDNLMNEYFYSTEKKGKELYDLLILSINRGRATYGITEEQNYAAKQHAIELFVNGLYEEKIPVNVSYHLIPMIINKYEGNVNISWSWSVGSEVDGPDIYLKIGDILKGNTSNVMPINGWAPVYRKGDIEPLLPENYMTPGNLKVTFPMNQSNETIEIYRAPPSYNVENIMAMMSIEELRYNGLI